jgi:septal ring factor EnvC (AmiA/AmiB activator)
MKEETLLRGGLAMTLLMCITFLFFLAEGWKKVDDAEFKLKKTQDSLRVAEKSRDSLHDEIFPTQIELNRYQIALELLKEEDKKAADKFELILTTQTE